MNKISIKSYYHETRTYTPEEYIKFRLLDSPSHIKYINKFAKNVGVTKAELKDLAIKMYKIDNIKSNATKEAILNEILIKENVYVLADMTKEKINEVIEKYGIHKEQYDICIDTINGSFELGKEIMRIQEDKEGRFKEIEEFADDPEGYMKRHSE